MATPAATGMAVSTSAGSRRTTGATFHSSAAVGRAMTATNDDEREPPQLEPFDTDRMTQPLDERHARHHGRAEKERHADGHRAR